MRTIWILIIMILLATGCTNSRIKLIYWNGIPLNSGSVKINDKTISSIKMAVFQSELDRSRLIQIYLDNGFNLDRSTDVIILSKEDATVQITPVNAIQSNILIRISGEIK